MKRAAFGFLQTRIGRRFLGMLLLISLIPLLLMRWLAIRKSEAAIEEQTLGVLRAASDGAEGQLIEFLDDLKERLLQLASDPRITRAVRAFPPEGSKPITELTQTLRTVIPSDAQEVILLDERGKLIASSLGATESSDRAGTDYFIQGADAFFAGDVFEDPATGKPSWVMSAPVNDLISRELLGVVALRIDPRKLSTLASGKRILSKGANTQSFRIGDTGETYIVNLDGLMITESRYASNSVLKLKVNTLPVRVALDRREEITDRYVDYRGTEVSGSSALLRNPPWILITEIDFKQAFAPIKRLRHELVAATVILIFLAVVFAWSTTWQVLNPIRLLSESDHALADRDEGRAFVPERGLPNNEVGDLVRIRNSRVRAVFEYQRQLEERTQKLQEMIGELEHISYAIVHDMRAPLRAMQGFATLLESDELNQTAEERMSYLKKISSAAIRLDQLIQDVLTYNRTVLRRAPLHPVDIGPLLQDILDTYPAFSVQNARIEIAGTMPVVVGNEALLTQCFSNLLDNAVKFSGPAMRPQVRIWSEQRPETFATDRSTTRPWRVDAATPAISRTGKFARLWIEDNGSGIPEGAQSRIFNMFQRLTDDERGTGIGLAIVRKVVEQMGGQVGVESEVGKGSRFWVDLRQVPPSNSSAATRSGTIDAASEQFVSI